MIVRKMLMLTMMCVCMLQGRAQEPVAVLEPIHYPYLGSLYGGYAEWQLHPGLNASLSAAAIFGLGRHAGSGFANSMAVMYADNMSQKLFFSIGGYSSFLEYASHQLKDAGLTAMLNYRLDDHWEASIFAQKSVIQPQMSQRYLYWGGLDDIGDKIGASLRYNVSPQFSIGLSVWETRTR